MAFFSAYCIDSIDGDSLRAKFHDEHIKYLNGAVGKVMLAGPCPGSNDDPREASLIILSTQNIEAAMAFLEKDPFYTGGVWEKVIVREFLPHIGAWAP